MRSVISNRHEDKGGKVREADARMEQVNRTWHGSNLQSHISLLPMQVKSTAEVAALTPEGDERGEAAAFSGFAVEGTS